MLPTSDTRFRDRLTRWDPEQDPTAKALQPPTGELPGFTWYALFKMAMDTVLALVLLVLTAPVILLAALLVKLTSRGPAFYLQTRLGRRGRSYTIYKIRTMLHNCEHATGPCWATPQDPRITRIGRVLRRLHIDELPQLWNVVRGDMSLVGPRPERPEFVPHLQQAIPGYQDRLLVRPGVTGLAQVQLPPDTDLESVRCKLAHDLYYVRHCSLGLDLRILFCTGCYLLGLPFTVLGRWLSVPGGDDIKRAYPDLTIKTVSTVPELEPEPAPA